MSTNLGEFKIGEGRYEFSVRNTQTGEVRTLGHEVPNRINDMGINSMGGNTFNNCSQMNQCVALPYVVDETTDINPTKLVGPMYDFATAGCMYAGGVSSDWSWVGHSDDGSNTCYYDFSRAWTFAQGYAMNIASVLVGTVGVGSGDGVWGPPMAGGGYYSYAWHDFYAFSQANLKDASGNPTTLNISAIEQLTITYHYRVYIPKYSPPLIQVLNLNGTDYTFTIKPALNYLNANGYRPMTSPWNIQNMSLYLADYGLWYSYISPQYTNSDHTGGSFSPTSSNTVQLQDANGNWINRARITFFYDLNTGNSGIGSMYITNKLMIWDVSISPPITKDNTMKLTLNFEYGWGRA